MNTSFDILFTVLFRHAYFSSSKLECLVVDPDKNTAQAIVNNGLLFKPFKDGFRILFETSFAGRERERAELLNGELTLRFILTLSDPDFYNYTSMAAGNIKDVIFYFRNSLNNVINGQTAILHHEEFASEKDLLSVKDAGENFFVKPFGLLDVELSSALMPENAVRFDKKASYWQYIVVGDHLKGLTNPAILNTNNQAVFNGPEKIRLPDKREALLFTSQTPINIAERPDDLFQLVENYESGSGKHKVIKRSLPVPDIRLVSSGSGKSDPEKKTTYSEIFIY